MNPIVVLAALGAALFLLGGSSSKAKASTTDDVDEKPVAAKPKPAAAKPPATKPPATKPTASAKPPAVKPVSSRKEGAPATAAKPKPKPASGDDLQALVDNYDAGNTPLAAAKPKPRVDEPMTVVDVPVPVNYVGPRPAAAPAPKRFDETKARKLAGPLAKHITMKKYDFSRQSLRDFQTAAALTPDGIYGPKSEGALRYYNGGTAPKALANPKKLPAESYSPPN